MNTFEKQLFIKMIGAKWIDRKFIFDTVQNIFPSVLERLTGTPVRLEEKIEKIPPGILTAKPDGKWSIAENIGHLSDLESLWQERVDDFITNKEILREADMENRKTYAADHNSSRIEEVLSTFRKSREETIQLIENFDEKMIFKSALHPRLKTKMRVLDLFIFVAEHDDHHLAAITEIAKKKENEKN